MLAQNIKLKPVIDESLIAGFVVEYGSSAIDLSGNCSCATTLFMASETALVPSAQVLSLVCYAV